MEEITEQNMDRNMERLHKIKFMAILSPQNIADGIKPQGFIYYAEKEKEVKEKRNIKFHDYLIELEIENKNSKLSIKHLEEKNEELQKKNKAFQWEHRKDILGIIVCFILYWIVKYYYQ